MLTVIVMFWMKVSLKPYVLGFVYQRYVYNSKDTSLVLIAVFVVVKVLEAIRGKQKFARPVKGLNWSVVLKFMHYKFTVELA